MLSKTRSHPFTTSVPDGWEQDDKSPDLQVDDHYPAKSPFPKWRERRPLAPQHQLTPESQFP